MSRAVLISIRPEWVEKILAGEKKMEVRKTRPNMETPFRGYIYCTLQGCNEFFRVNLGRDVSKWNRGKWADRKGNVIGEFICDRIYELAPLNHAPDDVEKQACLTREEIVNYLKGTGYGWHISKLKIYDTPKELSKFSRPFEICIGKTCDEFGCALCENGGHIKRPPQSWCYVEELGNG